MKEAMFYKPFNHGKVKCLLCPHGCIINNGESGRCIVRKNIEGKLYATAFGKISGYAYDPIEKKPLKDYMPGSMVFSMGSYGCNLRCQFCQNYEIALEKPFVKEFSVDEIINLALSKKDNIGIAYTYNEPLINFEFVLECARKAKLLGLKNILVTNGFINPEPFKLLLEEIDALNIDLKGFNQSFYKDISKGSLEPVKKSIQLAHESAHVEITTMLIDDLNTSKEELIKMCRWIASIDSNIPLHLSRYFPRYKMKNPKTKISTLFEVRDIAKKHLKKVYLGNI